MSPTNKLTRRRQIPIVVSTSAYGSNDVLGVGGAGQEVYFGSPGGRLVQLNMYDADNQKPTFTVYVYRKAPIQPADNAAWSANDASLQEYIGSFPVASGDWTTVANEAPTNRAVCVVDLTPYALRFAEVQDKIYLTFKVTSTPTFTGTSNLKGWLTAEVDL